MNSTDYKQFLEPCCTIAVDAGRLIMEHFHPEIMVQRKIDSSPVTIADQLANQWIVERLQLLTPHIPIVAEEDEHFPVEAAPIFWLVDPLDGTRAFINGEPEFTVNIGLIVNNMPVLGIIYAPPQDLLYYGGQTLGAYRKEAGAATAQITARAPPADGLVVVKSKSHPSIKTKAYLDTLTIKAMRPVSSSIKFCMVAEGSADIYPRFGRTMEWDTAAGHAILDAAGGRVETLEGAPLVYGKKNFDNAGFIAFGR